MVQIAVCGPAQCSDAESSMAYEVGALLARHGAVVLCGGGTGVMAAALDGARSEAGLVVAIRPDDQRTEATVTIRTNMSQARNAILVTSADAVITIGGSWGTLSETALARRAGVPVVALAAWTILDPTGTQVPGILPAATPTEAVTSALTATTP
jgi:uncharacterized protein (TIGR00725 family)